MDDNWEVPPYEKFVFDLKTPKYPFTQESPMSAEDQHEWLEARRVTLMTQLEVALAVDGVVPDWLAADWMRLQQARDSLLRHVICQDNWELFARELRQLQTRLCSLLQWPICDSWDTRQLKQLSGDWLLVCRRLQSSRYHRHHVPHTQPTADHWAFSSAEVKSPAYSKSARHNRSAEGAKSPTVTTPRRTRSQFYCSPTLATPPCRRTSSHLAL